ncbi:tyrosine-type recombinase/integrase [Phocaeicola vulgatus]|uniref:Tyrosine-type recombinase/integrase n=2 Tax=Phocaeicola TaxID=909656 RepID=A0A6I0HVA2_PHOVU|nr:tyrosine-type recombinase/integrase [Phocaeicola vulgatus]TWV66564.1 tyrosine-type recombinase/integrase [Phocaeicola dorei]KAB3853721.1 tyrosine-type recombinase/integrase [Phocaeicola vulgatus]KAB3863315.1 tyrosine-type recombinase/integrase [Phocaeicola vulgatus]KAB3865934.1 tyrosine-type recombinase/integrase [Phocaeicola vulgatus]
MFNNLHFPAFFYKWKNIKKWLVSNGLRYHFFSFPVLCLPILFHVSRHTCATLLVHQGVPITTVQKLLGHTSVKTTQIYSEVLSSTIVRDLKNVQKGKRKVKMFPDKGLRTSGFIDNR